MGNRILSQETYTKTRQREARNLVDLTLIYGDTLANIRNTRTFEP